MTQRVLLVFLLNLLLCAIPVAASSDSGSASDSSTLDRGSALLSLTARQKRFVDHVAQDIQLETSIITSCRDRLQHQIDRTPFGTEPNQQQGVQRLLSWFKSEGPWLQSASRRVDSFQAQLSEGKLIPPNELASFYQEWIRRQQQGGAELEGLLSIWEEQRQQLAEALLRRRELIAERELLQGRERFRHDEKHPVQRDHREHEDDEVEERLQQIDTLLLHLPTVDEVVLADYQLLIEEGEAALNRLNRRQDEHQTVQERTILLSKSNMDPRQAEAICREIANGYQQQIAQLDSTIDRLEQREKELVPVGNQGEIERYRAMESYYQEERGRQETEREKQKIMLDNWLSEEELWRQAELRHRGEQSGS